MPVKNDHGDERKSKPRSIKPSASRDCSTGRLHSAALTESEVHNESAKRLLMCINAALQKKAKNIVVLNVKEISSFTDYMIICSGTTERQTQGISSAIQQYLKKTDIRLLGKEGELNGQWILLDYDDVVISIFLESVRSFYDIENLWDAPRMAVKEDTVEVKRLGKGMK